MSYTIAIDPAAARELKKLDPELLRAFIALIDGLADEPRPPGAKKLKGSKSSYRVRVGDHSVLYQITDKKLLVVVVRVGHRRDVYRG